MGVPSLAQKFDNLRRNSGNLLKPSLDMLLFTSQLSRSLGVRGTVLLFVNYYATVSILRAVTPAFGRLASVEAKLEGEYRAGMGRIGREAEEIAYANRQPLCDLANSLFLAFMMAVREKRISSRVHTQN